MSGHAKPWVIWMLDFGALMRASGHRCTFMHFGQTVRQIGVCGPWMPQRCANDNGGKAS
jgi:hypothetical protein